MFKYDGRAHRWDQVLGKLGLLGSFKQNSNRIYVGRCIFHNEKAPSLKLYPDMHAHCYGCGMHSDVVKFVAEVKGLATDELNSYQTKELREFFADVI